jgi:methylmalonyl-CoA/ethylmalonyl-CoA epimerase
VVDAGSTVRAASANQYAMIRALPSKPGIELRDGGSRPLVNDEAAPLAQRLDHVAIAAHRIADLVPMLCDVLGAKYLMGAEDHRLNFRWAQFQFSEGGVIEVMEPVGDDGFLQDFLKTRGEGLHHVTLRVKDIRVRARELEARGWTAVKPSFEDPVWKEMFLHPRDTHGVLIQLAESELSYQDEVAHHQQLDLDLLFQQR